MSTLFGNWEIIVLQVGGLRGSCRKRSSEAYDLGTYCASGGLSGNLFVQEISSGGPFGERLCASKGS